MKKKLLLIGIPVMFALALSFNIASQAYINPNIEQINDTIGLSVSPVSSERFNMEPGGEYTGQFRVRHTGHEIGDMVMRIAPLTEAKDYEVETERTQIKQWTTFAIEGAECAIDRVEDGDTYFVMRPQEECFVSYTIKVPENAVGGSQDAAILIKTAARSDVGIGDESGGVQFEYQFAYTLYSDVSGAAAGYAGKILENNVPWLLFNPPLLVNSKVENTGSLDFITKYSVQMNNWFGGAEVLNKSWDSVTFADSVHDDSAEWKEAPMLGLFEVTQKIYLLDKVSEVKKLVLIVPIWLIIIILAIIILLATAIHLKRREHKKRHHHKTTKREYI